MSYTQQIAYETLRSVDSSTLSGSYVTIGGPLLRPASIIKVVNNSTVLILVSVDGVNAHDVVPAGSFFLYDESMNRPLSNNIFMPKGTQFFVNGAAGTGLVYLVAQYVVTK